MNKPVGGRGHKAPYETKILRVPVPLVTDFEGMIEYYRNGLAMGIDSEELMNRSIAKRLGYTELKKPEALVEAKKILSSRKSARQSLLKLLQVIYGNEITEDDLKD